MIVGDSTRTTVAIQFRAADQSVRPAPLTAPVSVVQAVSEKAYQVAPNAATAECEPGTRDGRFGSLTGLDRLTVPSVELFRVYLIGRRHLASHL